MKHNDPIYIGPDAINELIKFLDQNSLKRLVLVCDDNTYEALGKRVIDALQARDDFDLTTIMLTGEEVIADAHYLIQVLAEAPVEEQTFIAVGGGTITDISRFISYRTRNPFISLPTSPSVDGFTSIGAPLVLNGVKQTLISQPPLAVFADLPTLQNAPQRLIASGFGDMVGKLTSLADWQLGRLLWDEPYDEAIAKRARNGLDTCLSYADEIGKGDEAGIRYLMDGLIESGLCMLEFGSSRPASCAEHHLSHYWEMMLLQEHRPALLHGQKVGYATTLIVEQYAKLRQLSRQDVMDRLEAATVPDREREIAAIEATYGDVAKDVIKGHGDFIDISPERFDEVKKRIAENWENIIAIADSLPSGEEVCDKLKAVQGPTSAEDLGLKQNEVNRALQNGHFLRSRFTVMKLSRILGIDLLPGQM